MDTVIFWEVRKKKEAVLVVKILDINYFSFKFTLKALTRKILKIVFNLLIELKNLEII